MKASYLFSWAESHRVACSVTLHGGEKSAIQVYLLLFNPDVTQKCSWNLSECYMLPDKIHLHHISQMNPKKKKKRNELFGDVFSWWSIKFTKVSQRLRVNRGYFEDIHSKTQSMINQPKKISFSSSPALSPPNGRGFVNFLSTAESQWTHLCFSYSKLLTSKVSWQDAQKDKVDIVSCFLHMMMRMRL